MSNKTTFFASVASAAMAFGLGALAFASPTAPGAAAPQLTPHTAPTPDVATDAQPAAGSASTSPSSPPKGRHAKPTTTPGKPAQSAPKGKHAKPSAQPAEPGSKGLFKDAEGDGKVLDDIGKTFVPTLPEVPDSWLPFPDGEGTPGTESPDANWGDPGLVCDPELAERLGVELSPTCSRDGDTDEPADTWNPEETWEAEGTWGPSAAL